MGFFSKLFGRNQSSNKTENVVEDKQEIKEVLSSNRTKNDENIIDDEPEVKTVPLDTILDEKIEYLLEKKNVFFQEIETLVEEKKELTIENWNIFIIDFFQKCNVAVPLNNIDERFDFINKVNEKIHEYAINKIFEEIKVQFLEEIDKHIKVLAKKFNILVYQNDYGDYQFDNWYKELDYFYSRYSIDLSLFDESKLNELYNVATEKVLRYLEQEDLTDKLVFDENMSPTDYEYFCADILKSNGLDARVTKASGDQGADVIVYDKNNLAIVVIQCKLYSNPVGNKAVQEIYSAKQHYGASRAIVVTNNTFTKSARQLANSTKVELLHHEDLYDLVEKLPISTNTNQVDNYFNEDFVELMKPILEGLVTTNYFILVNHYIESNDYSILNNYFKKFFISINASHFDNNETIESIVNSKQYKDLELFFKIQIFHKLVFILFAPILKLFYDKLNEENTKSKIHELIKSNILKELKNVNLINDIDEKINESLNILFTDESTILYAVINYIHFNIYTKNPELFLKVKNYSDTEWKNILISKSKEILKNEFSYLDFPDTDDNILIINFSQWHQYLTSDEKSKLIITEDDLQ
ncbi:restriction endonuclease [Poseidonibacter lekithochrous]|uniref:restriction endonuclease n=1 Tax=Poseidonibacter TaxID=2321187 RepID=UPI001C07F2B0|nr:MULTISPECIES: restriction endonuclease [Poseidonibacter]MBU3013778.1 restriction endonuclease [Poseidonibacter lekithochrous]MDO6827075.1 restriction endonuclease [Poseidonibacter sp. 1_MG-2023]